MFGFPGKRRGENQSVPEAAVAGARDPEAYNRFMQDEIRNLTSKLKTSYETNHLLVEKCNAMQTEVDSKLRAAALEGALRMVVPTSTSASVLAHAETFYEYLKGAPVLPLPARAVDHSHD